MERYETEIIVGIRADSYDEAVNEIVKKLNEIDGVYLIIPPAALSAVMTRSWRMMTK